MSTRLMSKVWPLQMSPTQKAVLISLADQANDEGYCWPAVGTIAERTCLSERAARNAIRWLEENGFLESNTRRGTSTYYCVTPERGAALYKQSTAEPDAAPEPDAALHEVPEGAASDAEGGGTSCPQNRKGTVNEPSSSSADGREFFAMHFDWQPSENIYSRMRLSALPPDILTTEALGEFKSYWSTRSEQLTQDQWDHKLVQCLLKLHRRVNHEKRNGHRNQRDAVRAAIHSGDKSWAAGL